MIVGMTLSANHRLPQVQRTWSTRPTLRVDHFPADDRLRNLHLGEAVARARRHEYVTRLLRRFLIHGRHYLHGTGEANPLSGYTTIQHGTHCPFRSLTHPAVTCGYRGIAISLPRRGSSSRIVYHQMRRPEVKLAAALSLFLITFGMFVATHRFVAVWDSPGLQHRFTLAAGCVTFAWVPTDARWPTWPLRDRDYIGQPGLRTWPHTWSWTTYWAPRVRLPGDYHRWIDIPLWIPLVGSFAWLFVLWRASSQRKYRRHRGLCIKCGYNLTGNTTSVCPECGKRKCLDIESWS